jgi:radical SAM superfamily enzyme YgiQ (UPF0313 family)
MLLQENVSVTAVDLEIDDISPAALVSTIAERNVVLVGISCVTVSFRNACRIAAKIKRTHDHVVIVIGGPHVTFMIEDTLSYEGIDAVCFGEGENVIVDLYRAIAENGDWRTTRGIAYLTESGEVLTNPGAADIKDLDTLPYPALHLFNLDRYRSAGVVMTTRGCPFKCFFCSEAMTGYGPKIRRGYRIRSVENVLGEVRNGIYVYGIREFFFADDIFTLNKNRTKHLCEALAVMRTESEAASRFRFSCEARADTVSEDLVRTMAEAGCIGIQFGLESGSQDILDSIGKGTTIEEYKDAVRWCARYGISTALSFMFPHPNETDETLAQTKALIEELRKLGATNFVPALTTPYPGTELYMRRDEFKVTVLTENWDLYSCNWPVIETANFKLDRIRTEYAALMSICQEINVANSHERSVRVSEDMLDALEEISVVDRATILGFKRIGQIT